MTKIKKKKFGMIFVISMVEAILILFSIVSTIFVVNNYNNKIKEENEKYLESTINTYSEILDDNFSAFVSFSYASSNSDTVKLLSGRYYDIVDDPYQKSVAINEVNASLNSLISFYPAAEYAAVLFEDENYDDIFITSSYVNDVNNKLYDIIKGFDFYNAKNLINNIDGDIYFLYTEKVYSGKKYMIKISDLYITNLFSRFGTLSENNDTVKIVNDGQIDFIATNEAIDHNSYRGYSNFFVDNGSVIQGDKILCKYEFYNAFSLYVIFDMKAQLQNNMLVITLIVSLIIVSEIIISVLLTYNFAGKPMRRIVSAMKEVEKGNLNIYIPDKTIADFQMIYDGFNTMTNSLSIYINENYVQQLQLKESEFRVLQSQINPHFLYNCFANISSLCQNNENQKAAKFTNKLAKYYFYITQSQPTVCVKDEYDHMMKFLEIQNIRFEDRISYEIDPLDEKLSNYKIPKLIFQPIVENSYKYVFSNMASGGILRLSIKEDKEYIYLSFSDNGNSVDDEMIEKLNQRIKNASLIGKHGLTNILRRLEFFSDGKSTISLKKGELGGLEVTIHLYKEIKHD